MKTIHEITKENFNTMFNLKDILEDSVYYPASGIDGTAIKYLSDQFCSFIHADYSTPEEDVEKAMRGDFSLLGYDLIGIKTISMEEMTPFDFRPHKFSLNDHEKQRLEMDFISDLFYCRNFKPFALWAVYKINPGKTGETKGKSERFSLLHVGGEACATFEAIYLSNKMNPAAVAIIDPGEGYGDNWTMFRDTNFRFYQNLLLNCSNPGVQMPEILLTNQDRDDDGSCFWPDYKTKEKFISREFPRRYMRI